MSEIPQRTQETQLQCESERKRREDGRPRVEDAFHKGWGVTDEKFPSGSRNQRMQRQRMCGANGKWGTDARWLASNHSTFAEATAAHLDKHLNAASQTQHQVQSALLLDVVVAQRAAVLQLLPSEDQTLLVRRNALLVLDLLLHVLDRVARLHVQRDRLARQRLRERTSDHQQTRQVAPKG